MEARTILRLGFIVAVALLLLSIGSIRSVTICFTDSLDFVRSLPLTYYAAYYISIVLIAYIAFTRVRLSSSSFELTLLLTFALLLDFPRYIFTYPFQIETFHQAQIYHIKTEGTLLGIPYPATNIANPIFWGVFTQITMLDQLLVILYVAPTFMWLLTVLILFIMLRRLSNQHMALICTFFFLTIPSELFFANRYSFVSPLFLLFLFTCINWYTSWRFRWRPLLLDSSFFISLALLIPAIVIAHTASAIIPIITAVLSFLIWQRHRKDPKNVFLFSLFAWAFWYTTEGSSDLKYLLERSLDAFIDAIRGKAKSLEFIYPFSRTPICELVTEIKIIMILTSVIIPLILAVSYITKRKHKDLVHEWVAIIYILFMIPFGLWVTSSAYGLRTIHLLLMLSPIALALLLPKRLLKLLLFLTIIFSLSTVYVLWIPFLAYIQLPNKQIELIKFTSASIPQRSWTQILGGVGIGWAEQHLLTHIFSNRKDLRIVSVSYPLSESYMIHDTTIDTSYIIIDPSKERVETKFIVEPSIRDRVKIVRDTLVAKGLFNVVYDCGSLYNLLFRV